MKQIQLVPNVDVSIGTMVVIKPQNGAMPAGNPMASIEAMSNGMTWMLVFATAGAATDFLKAYAKGGGRMFVSKSGREAMVASPVMQLKLLGDSVLLMNFDPDHKITGAQEARALTMQPSGLMAG